MFDDTSSWFDDIGEVLGVTPPPAEPSAPVAETSKESSWLDSAADYVSDVASDAMGLFADDEEEEEVLPKSGTAQQQGGFQQSLEQEEEELQPGTDEEEGYRPPAQGVFLGLSLIHI